MVLVSFLWAGNRCNETWVRGVSFFLRLLGFLLACREVNIYSSSFSVFCIEFSRLVLAPVLIRVVLDLEVYRSIDACFCLVFPRTIVRG